jgi:hypothetical protein
MSQQQESKIFSIQLFAAARFHQLPTASVTPSISVGCARTCVHEKCSWMLSIACRFSSLLRTKTGASRPPLLRLSLPLSTTCLLLSQQRWGLPSWPSIQGNARRRTEFQILLRAYPVAPKTCKTLQLAFAKPVPPLSYQKPLPLGFRSACCQCSKTESFETPEFH